MATKVKGKKTKRARGSQPTMTATTKSRSGPDGRARVHTHPSQMPKGDAIRHIPGIVIRANRTVIAAITLLAEERGISRNALLIELMTKAIEEAGRGKK